MQTEVKKEKEEQKTLNYMPINNPDLNKAYNLIKGYESKILYLVAFSDQTVELKSYMKELRDSIKKNACVGCTELDKTTTVPNKLQVQVLVKDDVLTNAHKKLVLIQEWTQSKKQKQTMDCLGCRALRDKQIATGYMKNRRFKQI